MDITSRKSRRRVLKRASNNPLTRPPQSQRGRLSSHSSSNSSNTACSVSPIGLRLRHDAKTPRRGVNKTYASADDSTGLSGFIVDDESYSESDSAEESPQEQVRTITRRLVRGRRQASLDSIRAGQPETVEDDELEQKIIIEPLREGLETDGRQLYTKSSKSNNDQQKAPIKLKNRRSKDHPVSKLQENHSSTDISDPSLQQCFTLSESSSPVQPLLDNLLTKSQHSPSKSQRRLKSPRKPPQIPFTPNRSVDAFWDQSDINELDDQFPRRNVPSLAHNGLGNGWESKSIRKPEPTPARAFARAKKYFDGRKHGIAKAFLEELDKVITDCGVSQMSAATGGVKIIWNKNLKTTAGRAIWKRETIHSTSLAPAEHQHHASIELSEKVIDDEDRLLNVIAHEFCHLANFMISGVKKNPHGKDFKIWAAKCSERFGDRGINVTTKHTYVIDYRYIWKCIDCGSEFKRHSKSIDPQRHRCGSCKSSLVQIKPLPRATLVTNDYQIFVRENMRKIKSDNPGSPQKDIMGMVSKLYQQHKASKFEDRPVQETLVGVRENKISRSEKLPPAGDEVDLVARRLKFIDLISP